MGYLYDLAGGVKLILVCLLVFSNARLLTDHTFARSQTTWSDYWLMVVMLVWAQVVGVQYSFGSVGLLRYEPVLIGVALLQLGLRVATRGEQRASLREVSRLPISLERFRGELLLLQIGLAVFVLLLAVNAISPPSNWDSLNYQLVFPVEWYKSGSLELVLTPFGDRAPSYYPLGGMLVFSWLLLPLGTLAIPDLGQAPFVLLAPLATFSVARKFGLERRAALWSAILVFTLPMLLVNGTLWSYTDVMMGVAFLLALNFALLLIRQPEIPNAVLTGLAMGLLIATKAPSLLISLPLFALLFGGLVRTFLGTERGQRHMPGVILAILLPILFLGGYSYFRNWLVTGNPFYPMAFSLMGRTIWDGPLTLDDYRDSPFYSFRLAEMVIEPGYFPHMAVLTLLFPLAFWKRRDATARPIWHALLLSATLLALFYFLVPIRDPRFLLPVAMMGCIALAQLLMCLGERRAPLVIYSIALMAFGVTLLALIDIFGRDVTNLQPVSRSFHIEDWIKMLDLRHAISEIVAYLFLIGLAAVLIRTLSVVIPEGRPLLSRTGLIVAIALFIPLLVPIYNQREYAAYGRYYNNGEFGPAWAWLNQNTEGEIVAFAGNNVPLPLYGTRLKNEVRYVSINDRYFVHEYGHRDYRYSYNLIQWLANIRAQGVDWLFITTEFGSSSFPIEEEWAASQPELFSLEYELDRVHIWQVNQPEA